MFRRNPFRLAMSALLLAGLASPTFSGDKDKPADKVLKNPAKDILVVSDREESIPAFFQRQRLIVGGLTRETYDKLRAAKEPMAKTFVNYTSHNDDDMKTALFGDIVTLSPMTDAVAKVLDEALKDPKRDRFIVTLILRRQAKDSDVYHVVGYMARNTVGFFDRKEKTDPDDFAPKELRFKK